MQPISEYQRMWEVCLLSLILMPSNGLVGPRVSWVFFAWTGRMALCYDGFSENLKLNNVESG